MFGNDFMLCKLIFRRDRLHILLWFVVIASLVIGFGQAMPDLFGTEEERSSMLMMMENPALIAMLGSVHLMPDGTFTLGAMYSLFMLVWCGLIMGIMNIFHVVRHTRQDEERGRIEVIRSLPVGRLSNLSATMLSAVIINVVFSLLLGLGLAALGIESMDFSGSMLFGAAMGGVGLVFAGITAIFCQLCANPRAAQSLALATLIGAYLLRAVGDAQGIEALTYISPLGLMLNSQVYTNNFWWPVIVSLIIALAIVAVSFLLCSKRDMGAGLLPARPGKEDAAFYLSSPAGLAWRLLKTSFIVWAIVIPVLSMSYGSIMGDIESFIETNEVLLQITGGDPLALIGFLMVIMSMCATIPVLQFILKTRSQENHGYGEHIIARSASRHDQLLGYLIIALSACIILPFLNSVGFWAGSYAVMDEPFAFGRIFEACMIYIPAMLFMLGLTVFLIGYLPRFTPVAWGYLGYSFMIIYVGSMVGVPDWMARLSPFGHIPQLPNDEVTGGVVAAMVIMIIVAVIMTVLGFIGHRRRDMIFTH